jgi:hypothetical protein
MVAGREGLGSRSETLGVFGVGTGLGESRLRKGVGKRGGMPRNLGRTSPLFWVSTIFSTVEICIL